MSTAAEVLVTKNYDFTKPPTFTQGLGRILGIGILLAEGDEHKTQRRNLSPAFSYRHVKDIYPIFWQKSRELVECLAAASAVTEVTSKESTEDGEPRHAPGTIDVGDWTSRATLDIIGVSGMGTLYRLVTPLLGKLLTITPEQAKTSTLLRIHRTSSIRPTRVYSAIRAQAGSCKHSLLRDFCKYRCLDANVTQTSGWDVRTLLVDEASANKAEFRAYYRHRLHQTSLQRLDRREESTHGKGPGQRSRHSLRRSQLWWIYG